MTEYEMALMGVNNQMENETTICFQTTPEIKKTVEKIAHEEQQSVSSVIQSIVCNYLRNYNEFTSTNRNRRRLERRQVRVPAFIGDPQWQRREFEQGVILDISFEGIRISVPKETKIEIQRDSDPKEIRVIFSLADAPWPVNLKCHLKYISESEEEVLIGASFLELGGYTYTTLQKYLI